MSAFIIEKYNRARRKKGKSIKFKSHLNKSMRDSYNEFKVS